MLQEIRFEIECYDSRVGIAKGYGLDGRRSTPGMERFILFSTGSRPALVPTQPPIQWAKVDFSPAIKRLGRESVYSPPSKAEIKNGGAIPSLPHRF
jgi:hypothetical protein